MTTVRLIVQEIGHRKLNFGLGLVAVAVTVALVVAVLTLGRASERETTRLMRDMGFNLLIVPRDTNMEDFWAADFADKDMPEAYVHRLADSGQVDADHYVAELQKRITWRDRSVLLTGLLPERGRPGKAPMGYQIRPGTCLVGFELARSLKLKPGDRLELPHRVLVVADCLAESGSKDDIRLFGHLHDVQAILGLPGRINLIKALGCICQGERLGTIRQQLEAVLPDTKVTELATIALARAETRTMMEKYGALLVAVVLAGCVAWVGVLAWLNVRERRREIGILRALGLGSGRIAALFLGKAVLMGLAGAGLGLLAGNALALAFGPAIFKVTARTIEPLYGLAAWCAVMAPLVTGLASFLPAMHAVAQDPAVCLMEE